MPKTPRSSRSAATPGWAALGVEMLLKERKCHRPQFPRIRATGDVRHLRGPIVIDTFDWDEFGDGTDIYKGFIQSTSLLKRHRLIQCPMRNEKWWGATAHMIEWTRQAHQRATLGDHPTK